MLPGFRFLFAAIVLSMSILVFGLGAAALLRAAHEEFASTPAWRPAPETTFAQKTDATPPVLAMLRIDTPVEQPVEQKKSDNAPLQAAPVTVAAAAPEPAATTAPKPEVSPPPSPPETAKPEIQATETPPQVETAPAQAEAPASTETKVAAVADAPPAPSDAVPAVSATPEQATAPVLPDFDSVSTRIAALGGSPVAVVSSTASAEQQKNIIKKRKQAERANARRRMAHRARLAAQVPQQQPADPLAASSRSQALNSQAGPVATAGPSGNPHSDHEPS
jgi:hypothetical protein